MVSLDWTKISLPLVGQDSQVCQVWLPRSYVDFRARHTKAFLGMMSTRAFHSFRAQRDANPSARVSYSTSPSVHRPSFNAGMPHLRFYLTTTDFLTRRAAGETDPKRCLALLPMMFDYVLRIFMLWL